MDKDSEIDVVQAARAAQHGILGLAQRGMPSAEMRRFASWALKEAFRNIEALEQLSDPDIMTVLARVRSLGREPWMHDAFCACLAVYRNAEASAGHQSIGLCRKWSPDIWRGEARIMSQLNLGLETRPLVIEDAIVKLFADIGSNIENNIQPHLRELLDQNELCKPAFKRVPVEAKRLGTVVNDLIRTGVIPGVIFTPGRWGIPLHQWRNIARHDTWHITGGSVRCWYGEFPKRREVLLTKEELTEISRHVLNVQLVLFAARAVFLLDRVTPLTELAHGSEGDHHSLEPVTAYARAAASYGFEISDFRLSDGKATVSLRETTDHDPAVRRNYVVPFVYQLWKHTAREIAEVIYVEKDGTPNLRARVSAEDCARVAERDWKALVPFIDFCDLRRESISSSSFPPG